MLTRQKRACFEPLKSFTLKLMNPLYLRASVVNKKESN